jgi:hypothetical protein
MSASAASSALSAKVLQTDGRQLAQLLLRLSELQVRTTRPAACVVVWGTVSCCSCGVPQSVLKNKHLLLLAVHVCELQYQHTCLARFAFVFETHHANMAFRSC